MSRSPRSPSQKHALRAARRYRCGVQPHRRIGMRTLFVLIAEYPLLSTVAALALLGALSPFLLGAVLIRERQVGIVIKKFGSRSLPPDRKSTRLNSSHANISYA